MGGGRGLIHGQGLLEVVDGVLYFLSIRATAPRLLMAEMDCGSHLSACGRFCGPGRSGAIGVRQCPACCRGWHCGGRCAGQPHSRMRPDRSCCARAPGLPFARPICGSSLSGFGRIGIRGLRLRTGPRRSAGSRPASTSVFSWFTSPACGHFAEAAMWLAGSGFGPLHRFE